MDAAGAVRGRAAPDALVRARAVAVLARGGMDTPRTVGRRATPLAVLLIVTMLVLPRRTVNTARAVTCRPAMPAFRTHFKLPSLVRFATLYQKSKVWIAKFNQRLQR